MDGSECADSVCRCSSRSSFFRKGEVFLASQCNIWIDRPRIPSHDMSGNSRKKVAITCIAQKSLKLFISMVRTIHERDSGVLARQSNEVEMDLRTSNDEVDLVPRMQRWRRTLLLSFFDRLWEREMDEGKWKLSVPGA